MEPLPVQGTEGRCGQGWSLDRLWSRGMVRTKLDAGVPAAHGACRGSDAGSKRAARAVAASWLPVQLGGGWLGTLLLGVQLHGL